MASPALVPSIPMMPEATSQEKIQVLLVEDHPMLRERLAQLINKNTDMEVCGEAEDVRGALALIEQRTPDLAVLDISLRGSNGFDLLKTLKERGIRFPVLVLSMHDDVAFAERALWAGARGYVSKSEISSEIMRAIRKVLRGEVYLAERMTSELIQRMSGHGVESPAAAVANLSDRELKVFQLIGQGRNTQEIARRLGIGASTVAVLRARIKQKMGVKHVAELYHRATEWVHENEDALS